MEILVLQTPEIKLIRMFTCCITSHTHLEEVGKPAAHRLLGSKTKFHELPNTIAVLFSLPVM